MIIVLIQEGKGTGGVDNIGVKLFNNRSDAESYCLLNTDVESKYWTYCKIIEEDVMYETASRDYV